MMLCQAERTKEAILSSLPASVQTDTESESLRVTCYICRRGLTASHTNICQAINNLLCNPLITPPTMASSPSWSPAAELSADYCPPLDSILASPCMEDGKTRDLSLFSDGEEEEISASETLVRHDCSDSITAFCDTSSSAPSDHCSQKCATTQDADGSMSVLAQEHRCKSYLTKKSKSEESSSLCSGQISQNQVRKLGDRIAALQQLVSPFGKTDTASVLLEAIGYIKFLQDQVHVLSTPYLVSSGNKKDPEAPTDLRSRGLCLVPISSTKDITNDNGADYWISGIHGCTQ